MATVKGDGAAASRASALIKTSLATRGTLTRMAIARHTGLPKSTVTGLVKVLLERGELVQVEAGPASGRGRTPAGIRLAGTPGSVGFIGLSHGGLQAWVLAQNGEVQAHEKRRLDSYDADFDLVTSGAALLRRAMASADGTPSLRALVVGIPGPFQRGIGIAGARESGELAPGLPIRQLPGWMKSDPAEDLAREFDVPALGENDANLAALGEADRGAGQGASIVLHVSIAEGIGAGLVIDGRLVRGASGLAGEIVHIHVADDGPPCFCGRTGCLAAVLADAELGNESGGTGRLTVADIATMAAFGRLAESPSLTTVATATGRILADVCLWLSPHAIVLDGRLGAAAEPFLRVVRKRIAEQAGAEFGGSTRVVLGQLDDRAQAMGAVALVRQELFTGSG